MWNDCQKFDGLKSQVALNQEFNEISNQLAALAGLPLRDIEKMIILETLKQQSFNRTRTARVLKIGIRTLQRKLKLYDVQPFAVRTA